MAEQRPSPREARAVARGRRRRRRLRHPRARRQRHSPEQLRIRRLGLRPGVGRRGQARDGPAPPRPQGLRDGDRDPRDVALLAPVERRGARVVGRRAAAPAAPQAPRARPVPRQEVGARVERRRLVRVRRRVQRVHKPRGPRGALRLRVPPDHRRRGQRAGPRGVPGPVLRHGRPGGVLDGLRPRPDHQRLQDDRRQHAVDLLRRRRGLRRVAVGH
mmetsp:Transcript_20417/g.62893  ORF Transcript_20417/g.62893 Transcript_20417/m.62893 type:complete len:216 (+) Transcript_20417:335-982(+)